MEPVPYEFEDFEAMKAKQQLEESDLFNGANYHVEEGSFGEMSIKYQLGENRALAFGDHVAENVIEEMVGPTGNLENRIIAVIPDFPISPELVRHQAQYLSGKPVIYFIPQQNIN